MTIPLYRTDAYAAAAQAKVIEAIAGAGVVLDRTVFYPPGRRAAGRRRPDARAWRRRDPGHQYRLWSRPQDDPAPGGGGAGPRRGRYRRAHPRLAPPPQPDAGAHGPAPLERGPALPGHRRRRRGTATAGSTSTSPMPDWTGRRSPPSSTRSSNATRPSPSAGSPTRSSTPIRASSRRCRSSRRGEPAGCGWIAIEGIDLQPCGGTHVRRTGEIGPVLVTDIEKKGKQNRRVRIALA